MSKSGHPLDDGDAFDTDSGTGILHMQDKFSTGASSTAPVWVVVHKQLLVHNRDGLEFCMKRL